VHKKKLGPMLWSTILALLNNYWVFSWKLTSIFIARISELQVKKATFANVLAKIFFRS
jgi:hypothetical protein